jgi:hypothetical protein
MKKGIRKESKKFEDNRRKSKLNGKMEVFTSRVKI